MPALTVTPYPRDTVRYPVVVSTGLAVSFDRAPDTRLLLAVLQDQELSVRLYDDSLPDAVAATVVVEPADVTGAWLTCRRSAVWDLLFAKSGDVQLRSSEDQGATWAVATTIATGYQDVRHCLDEATGLLVAALWKEADDAWYQTVGTLDSAGTTWTFSTPTLLVGSAKQTGDLRRRRDGTLEFVYSDTSDVIHIVRCDSMDSASNGTWS